MDRLKYNINDCNQRNFDISIHQRETPELNGVDYFARMQRKRKITLNQSRSNLNDITLNFCL